MRELRFPELVYTHDGPAGVVELERLVVVVVRLELLVIVLVGLVVRRRLE